MKSSFSLLFLSALAVSTAGAQTAIDLRTQAKSVDFSAASSTKPLKTGTSLPATCAMGEMFFKSNAPAGSNLYGCVAANTWSLQAGGGSGTGGTVTPNVSQSFTAASAVTVNHALSTTNVLVQCYDTASKVIEANSITVIDANSVTVAFSAPQSGRCVVNGTGGTGGAGGGGSGETITASNAGVAGTGPFHQKFGSDLQFKNINAGSARVTVSNDAANREIDIDVSEGSLDLAAIGGALNAAQVAAGSKQGTGSKLQTFGAGSANANDCAKFDASGAVVSAGAPCGTSSGGEANTASNAGVSGVGVFHQKAGFDLQFKNINAASSRVTVSNDAANREVDIDVAQASLDLSQIGGALIPSQITSSGRQGNGTKVQMFGSGAVAANDCAKFDANGNIVSAGAACGGGGGSGDTIEADFGIVITQTGAGVKKVGVDTAAVPSFLTASATLDFSSIGQSACAELTVPVPGAATGDSVAPGWPHTLEAGLTGSMFVSAQNTVTVRLCKITSGSVDPANQAFRATIVRSF